MASSRTTAGLLLLLVAVATTTSLAIVAGAERLPPLANGLSFEFYKSSCPQAESIVFGFLQNAVRKDIGLAAALLRLHFHDCFVQGCDGSILLDKLPADPKSEKDAPPNLTLRRTAFQAIDDLRALLESACPGGPVVSCADIVALAARDSVHLAGGPRYSVPLGRRDGLAYATEDTVLGALPPPSSSVTELMTALRKIKLDEADLVALSGAHTLGIAHCGSFEDRLYPKQDATLGQWFAKQLRQTCPAIGAVNSTVNDIRTPNVFDNKYYVDLLNKEGLFNSDQDLHTDGRTKPMVVKFAVDQAAFFEQFVFSVVKMGQINVLTGSNGQVRRKCSVRNAAGVDGDELPGWSSVLETAAEVAESMVL